MGNAKKIGFVDYYLSEWHANNYPAWLKEVCEETGARYEVAYAWAERDVSPRDGVTTDEWCEKMGVTKCETLAELCEKSDVILVLAPSDPETHLRYAEAVLPYGKPTYIDKTFAPDLQTAKEILAIAKKHGTPVFSTSALRYAEELDAHKDNASFLLTGGGSNLPEYAIHLVEMTVMLLRSPACRVKAERQGPHCVFLVEAENGQTATILYSAGMGYNVDSVRPDGTPKHTSVKSAFFKGLMHDIIRFYESGKTSFDPAETLEAMRLRDALLAAAGRTGEWLPVEG